MSFLKKLYKNLIPNPSYDINTQILNKWKAQGEPLPPPHLVKRMVINDLKAKYQYNLFIETGTYLGDMVEAQKNNFSRIFSIELGENLFIDAVNKFKHDSNITIINGDSGDVLNDISAQINEPAIFWLDGHYSAGITAKGEKSCPVFEELSAIFNSKPYNHILLIDDARLFVGEDDYPSIDALSDFIKTHRPDAKICVKNDIIHVFI